MNNTSVEIALFSISGSAALFSLILTAYLVFRHIKHWSDASGEQRYIVRILVMVPIYSVVSWLAIVIGEYALYFELVRDCYEAYALYQFFCLLVHYVQKEAPAHFNTRHYQIEHIIGPEETGKLLAYFGETAFPFPLGCMTYQPGNRVFMHIKRCCLQYVFVKPCLAAVTALLQILGVYHGGSFDYRYGYFWIATILNISTTLALFFILMFYELIKKVVAMHEPFLKLVSIKILVFFVFWQGLAVGLLYYLHVLPAFFGWSTQRSSETMQNLLICVEMMGLSVFNLYAFPYASYRAPTGEHTLDVALVNIQSVLSQSDIVADTVEAFHPDRLKHSSDNQKDK